MSVRTARFLIAAVLLLGAPALVQAQWITFTDATASYLSYPGYATDAEEKDFSLADLDKDGDLDLVVVRKQPFYQTGARTHVLLMNVGGVMTDQTATYAPGFNTNASLARLSLVADFDGDTWLDVIVVNTNSESTLTNTGFMPQYYKNLGMSGPNWLGLQFETGRIPSFTPEPLFCSAAVGDADGDSDLDVFLGDYRNSLEDRLIINDGTGHFTDGTATAFPSGNNASGFSVESTFNDVEADGDMDIIESMGAPSSMVRIHVNNGSGVFTTSTVNPTASVYFSGIGDFNNDAKMDIFVGRDDQDQYMINTSPIGGPISFTTVTLDSAFGGLNPKTTNFSGNATIADMDGDGDNDLVMGDADADVDTCSVPFAPSSVMLRNGTFGPAQTQVLVDPWGSPNVFKLWHTVGTHDIAVLDLNNDGQLDMIHGRCTGYNVFIQDGQPFFLSVTEPLPGALNLSVNNGVPNLTAYTLVSFIQLSPPGSGAFFGLDPSAFTNFLSLVSLGDPIIFTMSGTGNHTFALPPGFMPTPFPTQWRVIQLTGPTGSIMSNVSTITF